MGILVVLLGMLSFLGVAVGSSSALLWDSTSCHLARPIPGSPLGTLSFLGKNAQGLALVHTHWDEHGRLQSCSQQDEPELTAAFSALCAGEITRGTFIHTPGPELQRALATLQSQWGACRGTEEGPAGAREKRAAGVREEQAEGHRGAPSSIGHQRLKRGWTMPGTLWCGVGDSAGNSTELGQGQDADLPWVPNTTQWDKGWDWQKLGLHGEEPRASGRGIMSYQLPPSRCRRYGSIPLAHLQPRTLYNASWSSPATPQPPSLQNPAPSKPQQKQHPQKRPPQWKGSKHPIKTNTTALRTPVASTQPDMSPTAWLEVTHPGLQGPWSGLKPQDVRRACRSFRHLDQCEQQIGPQETKFQLLNSAHEPLFHCNCTRRLARFLRLHSPPAGTSVLWELLGTTCFKLTPPLDCAEGTGCFRDPRAIKVSARHLQRLQQRRLQLWGVTTDEGQVWPSNHPRAPMSFYDRCLQLTQAAWRPDRQQKS
uniref:Phospholipase A2-like central domain-containing protein n=1 Tax=Felis catus TaxID=9685 RepID=A0ABI7ZMJ1_FELCA